MPAGVGGASCEVGVGFVGGRERTRRSLSENMRK